MPPQNGEIGALIQPEYSAESLAKVRDLLFARGTLAFPSLPNGLFTAALVSPAAAHTGYQAVWVRDNVHIAHSLMLNGEPFRAAATVLALTDHFGGQVHRFDAIIADPARAADAKNRPHVKFNAGPLGEIPDWSHAQNDALGYFLWIYARMARLGHIPVDENHASVIARFPPYFEAIRFWSDEDSGHWEEARKNSASSVGTVCAGLHELLLLLDSDRAAGLRARVPVPPLEALHTRGLAQLGRILPAECVQPPPLYRRYDAALLFLVYPLDIVDEPMADQIVQDVSSHLQGDHGIRRYLGDSFWSTNYRRNVGPKDRTRDYSHDLATRDRLLEPGGEAEWCIFDPILSVIFGRRYRASGDRRWLGLQTAHFNRALSQITPGFRCPELWHWETAEDGFRVLETSEATPLLWTQANLLLALSQMKQSL